MNTLKCDIAIMGGDMGGVAASLASDPMDGITSAHTWRDVCERFAPILKEGLA